MPARATAADLIIRAARVHTLSGAARSAAAIIIRDGRIVGILPRRAAKRWRGRGTRVLDLGAATVTPGLVDVHTHFLYWALARSLVIDVGAARSLAEAQALLRRGSRTRRVGEWIVGQAFDKNVWGTDFPTAADLDDAVPDRPALVRSRDWHSVWLNTRGLAAAGITAATIDPPGGRYLRDAQGRPTGIVQEAAIEALPNPLLELARRTDAAALRLVDAALQQAYEVAWSVGVVGVHSMDDAASLRHFQRARTAAALGVRVVHAIPLANLAHAAALGLRSGLGDEWLRIGAVKIFSDGALGSQTALMFDDYPGRPGYCGVPVVAGDELKRAVRRAVDAGFACWIHAIGDRAGHETISALAAAPPSATCPIPHRIEHAQCLRAADIRRMARAGIVASMQPCHLLIDIATADRHWPRARRDAYAMRRMLNAGATLAFGSDVPIESLDPRRSFFAGTQRTDERGEPAGGWFAEQRLTAAEMLRGFTVGAARAAGCAAPAGTLAPGTAADLTIWGADPLRCRGRDLLSIPIRGCVVGGAVHLNGSV